MLWRLQQALEEDAEACHHMLDGAGSCAATAYGCQGAGMVLTTHP